VENRNEDDPTPCAVITVTHITVITRGKGVLWTYYTCAAPYCCNCAGNNTDTSLRFCMPLRSLSPGYETSPYLLFTLYRCVVCTHILSVNKEVGMERSQYRDSLRATQSGESNPGGGGIFVPFMTGPLDHLASCTMGAVFFRGKTAGVWC